MGPRLEEWNESCSRRGASLTLPSPRSPPRRISRSSSSPHAQSYGPACAEDRFAWPSPEFVGDQVRHLSCNCAKVVIPMPDQPQHPPTIELGEARLRPLRMSDAEALYADLRDPAVTALTSYPVISVPLVESMIERSQSRWAAGELLKWGVALRHNDRLVGTRGFTEWSPAHRWAEAGIRPGPGSLGHRTDATGRGRRHSMGVPTGPDRSGAGMRPGRRRADGAVARAGWVRAGGLPEALSRVSRATPRFLHRRSAANGVGRRARRGSVEARRTRRSSRRRRLI